MYFGLAIANEALRPVAALLLYRVFKERDSENQGIRGVFADVLGGNPSGGSGNGGGNQEYQPLSGQDDGQSGQGPYQATSSGQGTSSGEQRV